MGFPILVRQHLYIESGPWASCQIHKIAYCACAENVGNVFPATDFKGNRLLAIPACITRDARAVMHVGIANMLWRGNRSRHSRCMRNPQFYVSGKRPMYAILSRLICGHQTTSYIMIDMHENENATKFWWCYHDNDIVTTSPVINVCNIIHYINNYSVITICKKNVTIFSMRIKCSSLQII